MASLRTNNDAGSSLVTLSAQAVATLTSADQKNLCRRGVKVTVDITAIGASTNLTVTIQGKDPVSSKVYTLLASAALAATGTTVLTVYPGLVAAANTVANDVLPATWLVKAVVAGSNSVTATIGASEIV